jgi:glycosyltransferase involved in cell wall biosynthesis
MRRGQNPVKFIKEVAKPERITVAVLNYIPILSGYYAEMLDVLKANLNSLREGADLPFDLMVFDNGSCEEVKQYLADEADQDRIQYLIFSQKNLGKGGAWNIIFGGAPGEVLVYSDNDAYFYKGWLSNSLKILEGFPNVGMVTARPYRMREEINTGTVKWAENNPEVKVEKGQFMSWEDFSSFVMSLGNSEEQAREWYQTSEDIYLTYKDVKAQVGASHWQFMAYKSVLQQFLPFSMDRAMGQVKQLDERMNQLGYLRLMPTVPYAQNMSNTTAASGVGIKNPAMGKSPLKQRFFDLPLVKRPLMNLYDKIFKLYY